LNENEKEREFGFRCFQSILKTGEVRTKAVAAVAMADSAEFFGGSLVDEEEGAFFGGSLVDEEEEEEGASPTTFEYDAPAAGDAPGSALKPGAMMGYHIR